MSFSDAATFMDEDSVGRGDLFFHFKSV